MKIAIIADSHDNVKNLEKLINWLNEKKINILIHAGDLCAPSVLIKTISPNFKGQIHIIYGNVGNKVLLEEAASGLANVKYYGLTGELQIENRKIAVTHLKEDAENMLKENQYDLVIFGHTHQSELTKIDQTQAVNPGTVGGLYNKATFAIYDTKTGNIEIKELDSL